eukprot:6178566-Pleurochrysis_carterae.AAC.3
MPLAPEAARLAMRPSAVAKAGWSFLRHSPIVCAKVHRVDVDAVADAALDGEQRRLDLAGWVLGENHRLDPRRVGLGGVSRVGHAVTAHSLGKGVADNVAHNRRNRQRRLIAVGEALALGARVELV